MTAADVSELRTLIAQFEPRLLRVRRTIHANPELARAEHATTALIATELVAAGLTPQVMADGSGLLCDIGPSVGPSGQRRIALRADLDALAVPDLTTGPHRSTVPGVSHACGHDVHAAVVLGAGLILAQLARRGSLSAGVRLIFQPAEEQQPGGALDMMAAGALDGVAQLFSVHCDPRVDVGSVGLRPGPLTSASDQVVVQVTGPGGHTSRPHLTADLVFALGELITRVPAILGRRLDPRSGVNLTWGAVHAGTAHNAIPSTGTLEGTLRCLDVRAWERAGLVFAEAVEAIVAPYGVTATVRHERGVPPVDNDVAAVAILESAAYDMLGQAAVTTAEQSLGGEDFAWYLTKVPGAMARLGTRSPGGRTFDLHQGDFEADEGAIAAGAQLLARAAVLAGEI